MSGLTETMSVSEAEQASRTTSAHPHLKYRRDIDGLRTLAILPVVLNHAQVAGFHGGYVGVDIFFVISGFLITSILVKDLDAGTYSIVEFYRRRALRIMPALLVALLATTAACIAILLPNELLNYAKSLVATVLFSSNIFFWSQAGYFAPSSATKPLLHTWSLAIEEQFYILWPLIVAWIGAHRPRRLTAVTLAVLLASLALSIAMMRLDATSAFFLLPSRAWELALGALLAVTRSRIATRWINEVLGVLGLAMICFAIKFYSSETPFPGLSAALPCVGAALLIATGQHGTFAARLLSLRPAVWIGQISYSLYLCHWPVIVFGTVGLYLSHSLAVSAAEVLLSILLGWLSWRFVEHPFRARHAAFTPVRVLGTVGVLIVGTCALAAGLLASGGLPNRYDATGRALANFQGMNGDSLYRGGRCFQVGEAATYDRTFCLHRDAVDKPTLLIVGDSHGAHLWPGLSRYRDRFNVIQATRTSCKPVLIPTDRASVCDRFFNDVLHNEILRNPPAVMVLAARWRHTDVADLQRTLADAGVRAAHPILIGPVPQYLTELPRLLISAHSAADPNLPARHMDPEVFRTDQELAAIAKAAGVPYISAVSALCHDRICKTLAAPNIPLQFDYGHFTGVGSDQFVDRVLPQIVAAYGAALSRPTAPATQPAISK